MDHLFAGKKILLGVTGGIAAYKSALLVREFVKHGAEVRVIMTPAAAEFITPLTFSTLTGNPVIMNIFPDSQAGGTNLKTWHIEYAIWADLMIIAPATVNTLAKIAGGFADNALTAVVSALRCPLILAPAADVDMYNNPIVRENLEKIKRVLKAYVVEAEKGFLASGLSGIGRMAEIIKITDAAKLHFAGKKQDMPGKKVLITAGPTFEDIDPVRYLGNRSSGKMGFELAKAAYLRGADVTLISGPSSQTIYPEIGLVKVRSAFEMKNAVEDNLSGNEILIMAAAVADYRPAKMAVSKIKKDSGLDSIKLEPTADILASLDKKNKFVVGFALETDNEKENAKEKLKSKNLNMIVLNSLNDGSSGFEYDTNKIDIFTNNGERLKFPLLSKFEAANEILSAIIDRL